MTKLTPKQDAFVLAYLETGNASEAYRRAYDVRNMLPATINSRACELIKEGKIAGRLNDLREQTVNRAVLQKADVINLITEIATADASQLSELQVRNCRHCWGVGNRFQWSTPIEYAFRCAEVMDGNAKALQDWQNGKGKPQDKPVPRDTPTDEGGYGFDVTRSPNPECPQCLGEGLEVVRFKDTRRLKGAAKRLFAGIKKTRDGIEIKQRDQDKALEMLAKIHGVFAPEATTPTGGTTITGDGNTVVVMPPDPLDASRAYTELMKGG